MSTENKDEQIIVDCTNYYIPRPVEAAHKSGGLIRVKGKSGDTKEKGRLLKPRLKHRPDGRKYVSAVEEEGKFLAWSTGEYGKGYVNHPSFVNPQKGSASTLRLGIEVLLEQFDFDDLEGIVGKFNEEPIYEHGDLYKHVQPDLICPFESECSFSKKGCSCIWRPYQLLTWGRLTKGEFVPLDEPIRGTPLARLEFRDKVCEKMTETEWRAFRDKQSKKYYADFDKTNQALDEIAAHKLIDNMQTMQRTKFNTANCYGIALHQFDMAVETFFESLDCICIRLAIGIRDPVIQTLRQAKAIFDKETEKTSCSKPAFQEPEKAKEKTEEDTMEETICEVDTENEESLENEEVDFLYEDEDKSPTI